MQNIATLGNLEAVASRAALTSAFNVLDHVIESRNSIPILGNARMTGDGSSLFITGTDLDAEIVVRIDAAAGPDFDCTIPAKSFKTLLKGAPRADYVALTTSEGFVSADFEAVNYKLQSLPIVDFPDMSGPGADANSFTMDGKQFSQGMAKVAGAMSTEETRYYLRGVLFHQMETEFRMVATDGHRLYCQSMPIPDGMNLPESGYRRDVIVPSATVATLNKLMKGKACPDLVNVTVSNRVARFSFRFEFGDITLTTKLIDGTFPDYQRVIPFNPPHLAAFPVQELADKIKAVSLISSERGRAFRLSLADNGGAVDVNNPDSGSAHAALACEWSGDEFEVGFNAKYVLEALDLLDGDQAQFHLTDSGAPAIITGADSGFRIVVMPMRV